VETIVQAMGAGCEATGTLGRSNTPPPAENEEHEHKGQGTVKVKAGAGW